MPITYRKISELSLAENIEVGVDLLELVQEGQSKRVTLSKLVDSAGDPIFYFGTDGKIGIGTNSPGAALEINGEARLSNAAQMGSQNASLTTKEYVDAFLGAPIYVSPSTETEIKTLPDASANSGVVYTYVKANSSYYPVLIKTTGGDTINGLSHIFLWRQNDCLKVVSDGSNWIIINNFKPYFYSGWINTNSWATRHLGFVYLPIDNLSGTPAIGDKCTGATNSSYGIVYHTDGSSYVWLANVVGGGGNIFEDNEDLAFDLSTATAKYDGSGLGFKNKDTNIYHGFGINLRQLFSALTWSSDGTENNSRVLAYQVDPTNNAGSHPIAIDTSNFKIQTATAKLYILQDDGTYLDIAAADDYYNIFFRVESW